MVAGGSTYHLPTCRLVDGRDDVSYVSADEASERGLRACRVCKPAPAEAPAR
jgi:methylphosphotriester-DNA--protein-cysteine methyltransferase